MKNSFWIVVAFSALILVLASCNASQPPAAEPAAVVVPEVETGGAISEVEPAEQVEPDEAVEEMAEDDMVEAEAAEEVVEGPSANEVAAMEKAAAGAIRDEERAPTFRGEEAEEVEVDADAVKSLADYLPILGEAPEIINGENWINSDPLTLEQLKGKVVLIEFWTYS